MSTLQIVGTVALGIWMVWVTACLVVHNLNTRNINSRRR